MKPESLPSPVVVASDVHLSEADPGGVSRFLSFVREVPRRGGTLLVAGDLFDVWTSPASGRRPAITGVLRALRDLVAGGTTVGFIEGNRDFEAAPALRALGVRLLPDVCVLADDTLRVAVTHGDRLCRRDVRYQAFRRLVRTCGVRHLLRQVPEGLTEAAGEVARSWSRAETARKSYGSMGLDPGAVAGLLRAADAEALVCGHVHWGRAHRVEVDGRPRDVVVLGAWDAGDATYAELRGGRLRFLRYRAVR